jgi:biotin carboxylase
LSDAECSSALEAGARLGYPFIVKPRLGRGGRGVTVVADEPAAAAEHRSGVAYQEFLCGDEYDVNLFVYPAGVPVITRVMLKTGLKQGIVGNATGVRAADRPDVVVLANEAARVMMLEGAIDMDIRMGENGRPKVLEVNARVGAHVLQAGGILERMLHASCERVQP